jgi:hypothetical protein
MAQRPLRFFVISPTSYRQTESSVPDSGARNFWHGSRNQGIVWAGEYQTRKDFCQCGNPSSQFIKRAIPIFYTTARGSKGSTCRYVSGSVWAGERRTSDTARKIWAGECDC